MLAIMHVSSISICTAAQKCIMFCQFWNFVIVFAKCFIICCFHHLNTIITVTNNFTFNYTCSVLIIMYIGFDKMFLTMQYCFS